jgi:two-component sensor histidine kinase
MEITARARALEYLTLRAAYHVTQKAVDHSKQLAAGRPIVSACTSALLRIEDEIAVAKDEVRTYLPETRLTAEEVIARYTHYLGKSVREIINFQDALKAAISTLESGDFQAYSTIHYPRIQSRIKGMITIEEKMRRDSYSLGFTDQAERATVENMLDELCRAATADRAVLMVGLLESACSLAFVNHYWQFSGGQITNLLRAGKRFYYAIGMYSKDRAEAEKMFKKLGYQSVLLFDWNNFEDRKIGEAITIVFFKDSGAFPVGSDAIVKSLLMNKREKMETIATTMTRKYAEVCRQMGDVRHNAGIADAKAKLPYVKTKQFIAEQEKSEQLQILAGFLKEASIWLTQSQNYYDLHRQGYHLQNLPIAPLLQSITADYFDRFSSRKLQFELQISGEATTAIGQFDPNLLRSVLDNLLLNALKYTTKGSVKIVVSLGKTSCFRNKINVIIIEVRDTGIGIPPDEINNIFSRGFRASNVGKVSGSGLGLSFVWTAAGTMGGEIRCQSKLNGGSTFTLRIPLTK